MRNKWQIPSTPSDTSSIRTVSSEVASCRTIDKTRDGIVGAFDYERTWDEISRNKKTSHSPSLSTSSQSEDGSSNNEKRDTWSSQVEFLLSCISMSVGLGNVWRFPFTAYENGGGAFLIPYFIVLVLVGRPLYFMELAHGQFTGYGPVKAWKCVPFCKGIGIGQMLNLFYLLSYYNVLMAICVFYLGASFSPILPWSFCDPQWADLETCGRANASLNVTREPAPQQYYRSAVLRKSDGIHNLGQLEWRLALALLAVWILVFVCTMRGVKSTGKAAYFMAIFPYVVLISLLVVGATLNGATEGMLFFVKPNWKALLRVRVWYRACEQAFFSLGVGGGVLNMFSSYNPFRYNVYRDAIIISVTDTFTSLIAGLTIFSIIGSMANDLKVDINQVVDSGPGLAFVAYPEAIARLSFLPQVWAVLFFMMLLTLGIGSSMAMVTVVMTVVKDQFPSLKKWAITATVCGTLFCVGLIYVTQGGQYVLTLVDFYGAGFTFFICAIAEVVTLMWIYGVGNFCRDLEFMLGRKMSLYWRTCWGFIVPVSLISIFVYALVQLEPLKQGSYHYPDWANFIGYALASVVVIQIPLWGIFTIGTMKGITWTEKVKAAFQPARDWGPKDLETRKQWTAHGFNSKPRNSTSSTATLAEV